MQIIVQEGRSMLSLVSPMQAHDDALRTTTIHEMTDDVRVFYQDYALVRVEAKNGDIELNGSAIAGIFWIEKGRRYQLKTGE